jgi:hypothetical protein
VNRPAVPAPRTAPRRVFLFGCPRSRTTVGQRVISQAANLATMPSTNWYLEHASTRILNGMEGSSREEARPFAIDRIRTHVREVTGVELPDEFGLAEALDRLATETGSLGWLEKTPLHVLSIPEIEHEIPDARFLHFIRDPEAVVLSLVRRASANPAMFGARHQLDQKHDEATWRACLRASLAQHGRDNHLLVHSEAFVDDPEAVAQRVTRFLQMPYRPPEDPDRAAAAAATVPSHRPWKRDAAGPVRRMEHESDLQLSPLDAETEALWRDAQAALDITGTHRPTEGGPA